MKMQMVILVAVGSALGGVLRYLVSLGLAAQRGFPWATLSVNVAGSFLIGLLFRTPRAALTLWNWI